MKPGDRFTRATVIALVMRKGRTAAECQCDCGNLYSTRPANLLNGISHGCRSCALKGKAGRYFMESIERALRRKEREYQSGAARRGHEWRIDRTLFRNLLAQPCNYCGLIPASGIDRRDNGEGYTFENSVACCKQCNIAKMAQSEAAFLAWVWRIAIHKGFSL